jgi:hypothetical protein
MQPARWVERPASDYADDDARRDSCAAFVARFGCVCLAMAFLFPLTRTRFQRETCCKASKGQTKQCFPGAPFLVKAGAALGHSRDLFPSPSPRTQTLTARCSRAEMAAPVPVMAWTGDKQTKAGRGSTSRRGGPLRIMRRSLSNCLHHPHTSHVQQRPLLAT